MRSALLDKAGRTPPAERPDAPFDCGNLTICGMGMRDVSSDQGFPRALQVHRDGVAVAKPPSAEVVKLNDQHAFLQLAEGDGLRVGDVIEFGISHPCTCLDRYRVIFGVDETDRVVRAIPTFFG